MRVQRFDERFIVRIEAGERVVATLLDFLRREGVGFANLSVAGALSSGRIGFWDPERTPAASSTNSSRSSVSSGTHRSGMASRSCICTWDSVAPTFPSLAGTSTTRSSI